jgi:WD40 repeat protein
VNFDGPVRVASTVGSGTATVTLSFDNWKGANVVPTTHAVQVLPAKESVKVEPVSDKLVGTLVHPDRKASLYSVAFSPDGSRLFATGYPSGVVQVFDAASRKELRRIETPPGPRASGEYAALTPDWKTLYVPVEVRKVKSVERDGKQVMRVEESGRIRVWDVATGEERAALRPPDGSAPAFARLSPDGQALVCVERTGFDADADVRPADVTVIWDLTTRTRRKLWDGFQVPVFAPDGKRLAIQETDHQAKTSALRLLDAGTSKELARLDCPEKDRYFSVGSFSPDGSLVVVSVGGKKGAPREVWFRDGKTLADRGRFVADADPDGYGWGQGAFTPDGTRYAILGLKNRVAVWDVAGKKVERTIDLEGNGWQLAFSPDGRTLAMPWMPKSDADGARARNPDPQDYPQPRVALIDLTGKAAPRTLISRHGFVGGVAFSPDGRVLAFGSSGGVHLFDLTK